MKQIMNHLLTIILVIALYILFDAPYLYYTNQHYTNIVKSIQGSGITDRYYSAIIVYIALAVGVIYFVLPRVNSDNDALMFGALFGIVSYAIFDFTTHMLFVKYDIYTAIMDTLWGGVLAAAVSWITWKYIIKNKLIS